tara:strand:+ start:1274 stop:1567 length:294 start_codon:yes stop_codon:yes gene_type:complete
MGIIGTVIWFDCMLDQIIALYARTFMYTACVCGLIGARLSLYLSGIRASHCGGSNSPEDTNASVVRVVVVLFGGGAAIATDVGSKIEPLPGKQSPHK